MKETATFQSTTINYSMATSGMTLNQNMQFLWILLRLEATITPKAAPT